MRKAASAWAGVATLVSEVEASLDQWLLDNYGVKLSEFRALTLISQAPDKELRVSELAHQVNLTPSSVTRLVSRLESKGLALREYCNDDGRGIYAVISKSGEVLLSGAVEAYEVRLNELLRHASTRNPGGKEHPSSAMAEIARLVEP